MPKTTSARPTSSLVFNAAKILLVILALTFITFMVVAITSKSLGGALIFVPSVIFGILSVLLVFKWWPAKSKLAVLSIILFLLTGWYSFHVMYKFIQPTVWPKKVVAIGNPWVIGNNIFTNNDYNNPVVIKLSNGTYRMYFHDHNNNMDTAVSTDGQHFGNVTTIFKGEMPTVIKLPNGSWRMYYFVNANQSQPSSPSESPSPLSQPPPAPCSNNCPAIKHDLVSATSTDGLHWTKDPGIRLAATPLNSSGYDSSTMIHPSVIRLSDSTYKLYYDGEVDPTSPLALATHYRRILSASSKDGLHWTKDPGYRIDASMLHTYEAYSPKALYQNGKVILHFTTPNGIYQATSTDGMHFTIDKGPVFSPGRTPMPGPEGAPGSYQDAYVLPDTGVNRIYFWINGKGIWYASQKI